MSDRHGRLRSDLADRFSAAARAYRRDLGAAIDEAIDTIRLAIERASEDRRRGEQHTRARLDQLAQVGHRGEQLAADLDRSLGDWHHAPAKERP